MEADKAIEQLSDYCDRGIVTLGDDFKDAVRMGKTAIQLLAYGKGHRLSDENLKLLLDAERRPNEPD
ncbi:hypothetical protein ES705_12780 [subsurface metagenome]